MLDRPTSENVEVAEQAVPAPEPAIVVPEPQVAVPTPEPVVAKPKRSRLVRARRFFGLMGAIGDAAIKLGIIVAVISAAYLVYEAATTPNLSIDDIEVPENLTERGYSSTVIARRIVDEIDAINTSTRSVRSRAVRGDEGPARKLPEVYAPIGDVSLQSVARQLRRFIGRSNLAIYGEVTSETIKVTPQPKVAAKPAATAGRAAAADEDAEDAEKPEAEEKTLYRVVIRSSAGKISNFNMRSFESIDEAIKDASLKIIEHFDPYVAVGYYLSKRDRGNALRMIDICLTNATADDDAWAKVALGNLYRDIDRDNVVALRQYEKTLAEHPDFPVAMTNIAAMLRLQGRPQDAMAIVDRLMKVAPDFALSHIQLGLAHKALGNMPSAEAALARAVQIDPKHEASYTNLALFYRDDRKDAVKAIEVFRAGILQIPRTYFLRTNLAFTLAREGRFAEARVVAEQAAEISPERPNAWYQLVRVADADGKIDDMIAHARKAIQTSDRDPFGWQLMGEYMLKNKRWIELEEAARGGIRLEPERNIHHVRLGIALLELKRPRDALQSLARAAELQPGNARTQAELARAIWTQPPRQRDVARAAQAMSAGFAGNPAFRKDFAETAAPIFEAEALRLEAIGRYDAALIYLDEAKAMMPSRSSELDALRARIARKQTRSARQ
jgi:tetratricopeptide (TPR) repeat protein